MTEFKVKLQSLHTDLQEVTFWKGVAIIMVIFTHSHQMFDISQEIRWIPMFCQMGCQLFFSLSCFLSCLSFDRNRSGYFTYLKRRLKSISIGYWLAILMSVSLAAISIIATDKNIFNTSTNPIDILENIFFIHGIDPIGGANNNVVKGGWFIGTLVILYVLFPLFYNLYTKTKYGSYLPIVLFVICFCLLSYINLQNTEYVVHRNSFLYFSFVNQLPSFLVGFYIYEWYKRGKPKDKLSIVKGGLLLVASFCFFKNATPTANIIYPFIFSIAFYYIFIYFTPSLLTIHSNASCSQKVIKGIVMFGKIGYGIYLTHAYLVFEVSSMLISYIQIPEYVLYVIWLPVLYMLSYITGFFYTKVVDLIRLKVYAPNQS